MIIVKINKKNDDFTISTALLCNKAVDFQNLFDELKKVANEE